MQRQSGSEDVGKVGANILSQNPTLVDTYVDYSLVPTAWKTEVKELLNTFFSKVPNASSGTYLIVKYNRFNTVAEKQMYQFLIFSLYNEIIPIFYEPARPYQSLVWRATYFMRTAKNLVYSEGVLGYPELPNIVIYKIA
jgi:hypothetical protein